MSKTRNFKLVMLLLALMAVLAFPGFARDEANTSIPNRKLGPINVTEGLELAPKMNGAVTMPDGRVQVIVRLSDAPAVQAFLAAGGRNSRASAAAAAQAQASVVNAAQASFMSQAASFGVTQIASTNYLTNTVTVAVDRNVIGALRTLPGVTGVYPNRTVERNDTTSTQLIGAPKVWDGNLLGGSFTGEGTIIAIVDSGIDYTHTNFGGPGDYSANTDDTAVDDTPNLFPAAFPLAAVGDPKVVGGFDYVGDGYDASGEEGSTTPVPDPDPIDCTIDEGGGHGSHVAGSAAGWGVDAAGDTYIGAFENGIFTGYPGVTPTFRIGPGVAPKAALLAMRVFGCNGSTSDTVILDALEDAVAGTYGPGGASADVINMSLGSAYGEIAPDHPYNEAVNNASLAGTAVVISAGNNNDNHFVTGTPGASNAAITVASTTDTTNSARAIQQDQPAPGVKYAAAYGAMSPYVHDVVTAPGTVPSPNSDGCTEEDFAGFPAGNIAVIDRGLCNFVDKANNAFAAGALGLIVINNQGDDLLTMANDGIEPGYDLPSVFIGQTDGAALKANLTSITMDPALTKPIAEAPDRPSSFSSRGPDSSNSGSFKPDIAAPGNTITSAGSGTGNLAYNISGTSMAAPHIAGVMALLREAYPDWDVAEHKALVMNTANNKKVKDALGNFYSPQRIGAGRVNLPPAFTSKVIAFNKENPAGVSISFGFPEVLPGATLDLTETITLENKGSSPVTYKAKVVTRNDMPGVQFTVSPKTVTVPANSTVDVTVKLTGSPFSKKVYARSDPTLDLVDGARYYFAEESGYVQFKSTGNPALVVPLYAAPRPAANVTAADTVETVNLAGQINIPLSGPGVKTGNKLPKDIQSLVSAFELVESSPVDPAISPDADLQYLGIAGDPILGYVYFAQANYGSWEALAENFSQIVFDVDQDTIPEFAAGLCFDGLLDVVEVCLIDINDLFGLGAGTPISLSSFDLDPVYPNDMPASIANTYPFKTNVLVIPFPVWVIDALFGNTDPSEFNYAFVSDSYDNNGNPTDVVVGTYDYNNPIISAVDIGMPLSVSKDGGTASLLYDFSSLAETPDLLLLHHHNATEAARSEIVDVTVTGENANFTLSFPENNAIVRSESELTLAWEHYGADTYHVAVIQVSGSTVVSTQANERLGVVVDSSFTAAWDDDELVCILGSCVWIGDLEILENGTYTWTVLGDSDLGEPTEAANGPYSFIVNNSNFELLVNGGFEIDADSNKVPDGWTRVGPGQQRCKANDPDTGDCAYFVKKANALLAQKVAKAKLNALSIGAGDKLDLSARVKTKNLVADSAKLVIVVKYFEPDAGANENGKDRFEFVLPADTAGAYQDLATDVVELAGTPKKIAVQIVGGSTKGNFLVDNVSLELVGLGGVTLPVTADLMPVPEAPADLRGSN